MKKLILQKINLKKKKIFLEDARYYVEDVRKSIVDKYGFELTVYKKGLNIKTPINLKLQSVSTKALRKGFLEYDKRKGWRGPLLNKKNLVNWNKKDLKKFSIEKIHRMGFSNS